MATERFVGAVGLAAVVVFAVGNGLWAFDTPDPGAPAAEIARFYSDASTRIVVGDSLSLVSIALFVLFASGFRELLARAEGGRVLSTTAFGGVILAMAAGLGAETIHMAGGLRAGDGKLTDSLAQSIFEISQILGFNAAGAGLGIFALASAAVALRSGQVLPRWLAILVAVVGLTLLTPLSRVTFGPGVLAFAAVAVHLLRAPASSPA